MAHWSGTHRKKAFFGWLAFAFLALVIGQASGSKQISDIDQLTGESHDAEAALDRAGLRPVSEVVFIQSDKLTIRDDDFRAAVQDVTSGLAKIQYVEHVQVSARRRQRRLGRRPCRARRLRDRGRLDRSA